MLKRRALLSLAVGIFAPFLRCPSIFAADPDLGPNVFVFDPADKDAQEKIHAVFKQQERAQFGPGRFALLFKPGRHTLDVPVGFFTHVAGLGAAPADVTINGSVWTDAAWMGRNATCNFWRIAENLTIAPTKAGGNMWAVSQAAPLRRVHVKGDLHLSAGGWSSGGFLSDCKIDGTVHAGSQQQWFSRNSKWEQWKGGIWNIVFAGCVGTPAGPWPDRPYTTVPATHITREKPFLTIDGKGAWHMAVPAVAAAGSVGTTWENPQAVAPRLLPLEKFHIAKPGAGAAAAINAALRDGKHLLITPGVYELEEPLVVARAGTIVVGLGLPTLIPPRGKMAMRVEATADTIISGFMIDAGPDESPVLLQVGVPDRPAGRADAPATLHDIYCRVGGYGPGKAKTMVAIHDHHVIGDNLWLWRADHGKNVGWAENTCDTGLIVDGNDVTVYGLFVEHTQAHQVVWAGERGRVFFYQSEMPYDPPSTEVWKSARGGGVASYKVADTATTHEAWGLGVYHVFKAAPVIAETGIEAPDKPGISLNHLFTFRLGGGKPGGSIRCVVNHLGVQQPDKPMTTVVRFPAK